MQRGSIAHDVLERTLRRVRDDAGPLTVESLPLALEELATADAHRNLPQDMRERLRRGERGGPE
jgi:hypothetical protein